MRVIGVADETRTIAFYRDLLGFKVIDQPGPIEAVYGPARVQFERREDGPQSILFFQRGGVHPRHAAIRARGGSPSEVEKVNWIKMEMFEIRDPDGHTLWFGQSYHQPHRPGPPPMLEKALPELPLDDG